MVETLLGQSRDQPLAEDAVLELILSEYELRVKLADHPTVAEYVARFPNLTERLQRLFALHAALDQEPSVSAAMSGQALAAGSSVPRSSIPGPAMPNPPSHPESSAAAIEKTRMYQAGDAADDEDDSDDSQPDLSFLLPSSKPGSIGVLGHYEVLSLIGQGAFGIVFKAFDESLHRVVAIKVMNPQLAATSPPRKRFLREARAAAAIRHDNIVQVYSVEEQPLPYLVMEFIDGQTLKQKLDGAGPLETSEVLHLGRQMAAGLAAAQAMGLIHRDIKPGNILIEEAEGQGLRGAGKVENTVPSPLPLSPQPLASRVKITDFGMARAVDDASLTRTGIISGTPMYMAPEQALGAKLDHRADLFSLGSVLYQMACGRPPFRAPNTIAVLRRVVEDTPHPLPDILPEIPDWLVAIITKLHAKNPDDRFQTAQEVAERLARYQSNPPERSRHVPRDEPSPPSVDRAPDRSTPADIEPPGSSRGVGDRTKREVIPESGIGRG